MGLGPVLPLRATTSAWHRARSGDPVPGRSSSGTRTGPVRLGEVRPDGQARRWRPRPGPAGSGSPQASVRVTRADARRDRPAAPRPTWCSRSTGTAHTPTCCCRACSASAAITGTDAAFATELTYGTLRRSGVLDAVISAGAKPRCGRARPAVRAVLRLGRLPAAAHPGAAARRGLVDRRPVPRGRRPEAGRAGQRGAAPGRRTRLGRAGSTGSRRANDPLGRLAFDRGYPRWIAQSLLDALDGDLAASSTARSTTNDRSTHLVARPGRISRDELLAAAGPGATAGPWSPYAVRLAGGDPGALGGGPRPPRRGAGRGQPAGRAGAGPGAARRPRRTGGSTLCAGPGGKAALLAGLLPPGARSAGRRMLAPHRARLVRRSLTTASGRRRWWWPTRPGRAGATAASTGSSSTPRAPDSARCAGGRRPAGDGSRRTSMRLQAMQRTLLPAALDALRRAAWWLRHLLAAPGRDHRGRRRDARTGARCGAGRRATRSCPASRSWATALCQLWPHRHGTDAMFLRALSGVTTTTATSGRPTCSIRAPGSVTTEGEAAVQIAPSILAADFARLADEVAAARR